jgi:D-3-phosphoglycerate dehydrogenase
MPRPYRVLSTSPLHPDAERLIRASCDYAVALDESADSLRRAVADADALIVRVKLPDDIFEHAPRLKACVRHGVGLDFIPVEAATRAGIPVANLPTANSQAVIEHTVGAIIVAARGLHHLANTFVEKGWSARSGHSGMELRERVLGVVGCGTIGRGVAQALHAAFGMRVLGFGRHIEKNGFIEEVPLERLFAEADVVTLHLPATPETYHLVDAKLIGRMKPTAVLVNTARGELVNEQALVEALRAGRIRGAALDVFEPEPLSATSPLKSLPNVLLTPHVAGLTDDSARRMSVRAAEEALRILSGRRPLSFVNPAVWDGFLAKHALR